MAEQTNVSGRFRKKPVVIDAFHYSDNWPELHAWLDGMGYQEDDDPAMWQNEDGSATILTLEGDHRCDVGDWIIRGVKGEFYPCKPDIFDATYEAAEAEVERPDPTEAGV